MEYTELSREVKETVTIVVQFDFLPEPITMCVFDPNNEDDIIRAIENRYISEQNSTQE